MEIGRALLKCESEIAATHNWRLVSLMHSQLEILPKYFPSDFIYSYFVPMAFFRILNAVSSKKKKKKKKKKTYVYDVIKFPYYFQFSEANTRSSLCRNSISFSFTLQYETYAKGRTS